MLEGFTVPAYIVALGSAAFFGAKITVMLRPNGNGHGRASGVFEGRALTLLETQTSEISEIRKIGTQQKDILQQLVTLLAAHDARAAEAIRRIDERAA